jgi:hypothetical protein
MGMMIWPEFPPWQYLSRSSRMESFMAADESKEHREKAKEMLERLAGTPSRDTAVAATVALGYAVLAVLDEIRAIRERAFPADKPATVKIEHFDI